MRLSIKNILSASSIMLILAIVQVACGTLDLRNTSDISTLRWAKEDTEPKTAVVLPFLNETTEQGLEKLVRESFYGHFSLKNYMDLELGEVDKVLETVEKTSGKSWEELTPAAFGRLFHTDYILYGKVKEFKKRFLGIYSQIAIKVEVEMAECQGGRIVFRKNIIKRSHEGGIPFTLFGIVPAALRSGFHMKEENTLNLIDRLNRELVDQIPDPPLSPSMPCFVEIQVASFLEGGRAVETMKAFEEKGFRSRIQTVSLGERLWHRILLGPYYNPSQAEMDKDRIAKESKFQPILIHHYPARGEKFVK